MRLRNNPNALKLLKAQPDIVINTEKIIKGEWNNIFHNENQIHIEVGMGKGDFVTQMALKNPNINYVGIEKSATITALALKKVNTNNNPVNLRLINVDADKLNQYFAKGEVNKVYLNFSDPWPKKRHAARRLTNIKFINIYRSICKEPFYLELKTDNDSLYEYTLNHFLEKNIKVIFSTNNLHSGNPNHITPLSEYEKKFKSRNKNINKILAIIK